MGVHEFAASNQELLPINIPNYRGNISLVWEDLPLSNPTTGAEEHIDLDFDIVNLATGDVIQTANARQFDLVGENPILIEQA